MEKHMGMGRRRPNGKQNNKQRTSNVSLADGRWKIPHQNPFARFLVVKLGGLLIHAENRATN